MFILDLGSKFFPSQIPDPNFFSHPGSQIPDLHWRIKYFNTKKWFANSQIYDLVLIDGLLIDCLAGACWRWEGWTLKENHDWWFIDWLFGRILLEVEGWTL
jgi:hypothetical protein